MATLTREEHVKACIIYDRFCNVLSYHQAVRLWDYLFACYKVETNFNVFSKLNTFEEGDICLYYIHEEEQTECLMEGMFNLFDMLTRAPE